MSTIKMGFEGLTITEQIERTRLIVGAITGNPNYVTPIPSMATMATAATDLETAYNAARNLDKIKMSDMRDRRRELLVLVRQLAAYVQSASDGDGAKILSSGFFVRSTPLPAPDIAGNIAYLKLNRGAIGGSLIVKWAKADYAVNYAIETSTTGTFGNERYYAITTRLQKELTGLAPGTIWVRVRGLGKERAGDPCTPLSIQVL